MKDGALRRLLLPICLAAVVTESQAAPLAPTGGAAASAPGPATASPAGQGRGAPVGSIAYQRFTLGNGLKVYVMEDRKAPMVYEVLWFNVGSKDEVARRTGFAHLFEHLMFKGSAHLPDGLLDQLLEAAGGWSNAFTSSDSTVYQNVASANFLERMLWIEADRMAGLLDTFDQPKLSNQLGVVLNERRESYENQPYGMASLLIQENLWPAGFGYHWPTIGDPADLQAATVADVAAFFRTYYVPNNATMVIAGDVRFDEVKRLVEKYFGWIPRAPEPARPRYASPPPLTKPISLEISDDVQVPRVYLAYRGPAAFAADQAATNLALTILADGKSSRLYKRLVYEEKIAQDVSADLNAEELAGTIEIEATAKPGVDPKRLVAEISEEVAKLATTAPTAAALERAQNLYEASFLGGLESTLQRAIGLAHYDAIAKDPDYFAKDLARYRGVTAEQVRAAAARYLAPTQRVILTVRPGPKAAAVGSSSASAAAAAAAVAAAPAPSAAGAAPASFAASGIADWTTPPRPTEERSFQPPVAQRLTLGNGLTVLLVEHHELPLVAMTLLAPGAGSASDPAAKLGLAAFTADLLDEGAGGLSALALSEEQDRLGASLDVFVDVDVAGVWTHTLTKTLEPTIDLLHKILAQPGFEERDVERVRGDRLTMLEQRRDRPRDVADFMLSGALYGPRAPYGHPISGFADDLRACAAADVRAFYAERWDPAKMTLVVAGDFDPARLRAKLEATLGGWRAAAATPAPKLEPAGATRAAPGQAGSRLLVSDRANAAQSDVRIGLVGPEQKDPRYYAFEVLRTALGDGFTSRLTQRLREQLGITYGVRATMDWRAQRGPFSISTALVTAETGTGIIETLRIVGELAGRALPKAELDKAKQNLIRAMPSAFETNAGTAETLSLLVQAGLPLDWYASYGRRIGEVTASQVQSAARVFLPVRRMVVSVVGDLSKVRADLRKAALGAPALYDAYGLPLSAPPK
jgi:zinc protease